MERVVEAGLAGGHGASNNVVELQNDGFEVVAAWKNPYREGAMRSLMTRLLTLSL